MKPFARTLAAVALLLPALAAQGSSLFFSMNGTETAASGAGGTLAAPGNYAAIFRDEAVLMVTPAAGSNAAACADRPTWAAYFGDDDGDGDFVEGVIGHIDALHLRPGATNPPSLFDFWISVSDDVVGPLGSLGSTTVRDGDVFRVLPGGGVQRYITETQVGQAMNSAVNFNVDGFVRNEANGDLFFSLTTSVTIAGATLEDGGVLRIPGTGYVTAPDGTVASVTTGSAQIVLHEVHVNIFFALSGQGAVGDLKDIALAPGGGTFTGNAGIQVPNMWFCGDTATGGAVVVSSIGGIASLNGVPLLGGAAFGLRPTDFSGLTNSNLTGLALGSIALAGTPRFLSISDPALFTPGTLKLDAAGCTPGPNLFLFANLAVAAPAGSFTPRTPVAAGWSINVPAGFRELYVDDFTDPFFLFMLNLPPLTVDAGGYASLSFAVGAIPPGLALSVQGLDTAALAVTTPVILVSQ